MGRFAAVLLGVLFVVTGVFMLMLFWESHPAIALAGLGEVAMGLFFVGAGTYGKSPTLKPPRHSVHRGRTVRGR